MNSLLCPILCFHGNFSLPWEYNLPGAAAPVPKTLQNEWGQRARRTISPWSSPSSFSLYAQGRSWRNSPLSSQWSTGVAYSICQSLFPKKRRVSDQVDISSSKSWRCVLVCWLKCWQWRSCWMVWATIPWTFWKLPRGWIGFFSPQETTMPSIHVCLCNSSSLDQ